MHHAMKVSSCVLFGSAVLILLIYEIWTSRRVHTLDGLYPCNNKTVFRCLPERLAASYYPPVPAFAPVLKEPVTVLENKGSGYDVVFLVKSKPTNVDKRKAIRSTWGSVSVFRGKTMCVIFVVGLAGTVQIEEELQSEIQTNGDVLQLSVEEDFVNLPKKSLSAFYWLSRSVPPLSKLYTITDDDCVINIVNMVEFITENKSDIDKSVHCGYMFERNAGVIRGNGKRSLSLDVYPYSHYPDFCRGGMVLLNHFYTEKIYQAATVTNLTGFHLEDVLLYGVLREKLGIENSIKNAINGGLPLVYNPWDDTEKVIPKMFLKWRQWRQDMEPFEGTVLRSPALSEIELDPK